MPTQPLLVYMDGPEGIASTVGSRMDNSDATMPVKGANTISYKNLQDKFLMQDEGCVSLDCMFCEQTFKHPEDLGKHVLTQHRPTLCEPAVLRVEAEYVSHLDKGQGRIDLPSLDVNEKDSQDFSCVVCGQTFDEAFDVEAHMRKHKDSFTYWCNVCGRRFKEPWFLKNHMRTHTGKPGSRSKALQGSESPITINEVVQDQVTESITSPYKICMVCGFLFQNKESLIEHSKVHTKDSLANSSGSPSEGDGKESRSPREEFLQFLNLKPLSPSSNSRQKKPVKWIAELDPFSTYQAWQLATKGKIAIGYGQTKDPGQEGSTDNDDSSSDKEELGEIWNASKANPTESTGKTKGSRGASYAGIGNMPQDKLKYPCREVPSLHIDSKLSQNKDKPTHCAECGKAFRTYHQLVLHSRVHKRDRKNDIEASCGEGKQPRACLPDPVTLDENGAERLEGGSEDGSEDGIIEASDKNEDVLERTKVKNLGASRECSYCGKFFRSNYYLNIHLRTHTGEKPYKCEFCEYAAAQKTSLRYHLERHHKDKHTEAAADLKNDSKGLLPSQETGFLSVSGHAPETKNLKRLLEDAKDAKGVVPPLKQQKEELYPFQSAPKTITQDTSKGLDCDGLKKGASVSVLTFEKNTAELQANSLVNRTEKNNSELAENVFYAGRTNADLLSDVTENSKCRLTVQEKPLNLSTASSQDAPVIPHSRCSLATSTCPFCTFRTLYPEVLIMHQRLVHKSANNLNAVTKSSIRNKAAHKARRTGCPPYLLGKDVPPLPLNSGKIKSPLLTQSKSLHVEKARQCPTPQSKGPILPGQNSSSLAPSNLKSCKPQMMGPQMNNCRPQQEMHHSPSSISVQDKGKARLLASQLGIGSSSLSSSLENPLNKASGSSSRGIEFLSNRSAGNRYVGFDGLAFKRVRPSLFALEQIDSARHRTENDAARLPLSGKYSGLLPQECSHTKLASSLLPIKQGLMSSEGDAINPMTVLKPYETYGPGPFSSSCGSSSSHVPSSSKEGKRPVSYQHLSSTLLQKRNYESFIGNAHNRLNDKKT
ncbi:zinc finger protein 217 [Python bivittatus]|uniref:Zinc finger protein 217 n=1 Tax=Python bivittatus TaxID=176946 RepID=A0A9F5IUM9_PYTBI|nr:zinc finger protein 217 [Python bivittatus]XP_025019366.1 zinc finger protein 217 [Python bivittatus]XP_025019367.1 zinc finger protein 217 [Python bivittatus]